MKSIKITQILVIFACLSVFALPLINNSIISPAFTQFLKNIAEQELIKIASKLSDQIQVQEDLTDTNSLSPDVLRIVDRERELLNLTKIKIFTRAGLIIYSTARADIGTPTTKDFFPALVKQQETRTDLVTEDKFEPGKKIFLVETYVPIIKNGRVIGVFEIYYNMDETRETLAKVETRINWIVLGTSLILLCAVLASAFLSRRSHLDQIKTETEKDLLIDELSAALSEIKTLRGILPLCSFCKKIRDDSGYWNQVDVYIDQNSDADISHSICPDCLAEQYPDQYPEIMALRREAAAENPDPSG